MNTQNTRGQAARRITAAERAREALILRRSGLTYELISQSLGISRAHAHRIVVAELRKLAAETAAEADALRALEVERLDRLLQGLWARAQQGELEAVDRALKIAARRASLLGLDRPTKVAPTTPDGEGSYEGGGLAALLQQQDRDAP